MNQHCIHCGIVNPGNLHNCPYKPDNLLKIMYFLKDTVETRSKFQKQFCPFPSDKEYDDFARNNNLMRLQTVRLRYFEGDLSIEDWYSELVGIALSQGLLNEEDFPPFLLYVWDLWIFLPHEQYVVAYEAALDYDEWDDIFGELHPLPEGAIPFSLNLDTEG